jgi:O-antigen/teichoic acid export membrane protein
MVLSASTLIQVLVDVGAREALIQNPRGSEEGHVTATWWMTVGRSFSIYAMVYVLAPIAAHFYGHPELTSLARIATLSIVFDGLMSPRAIVAMKEMKFTRVAIIDNGGAICGVLITVVLSLFFRDVWALVIGFCSENAIRCILSFALCPYRPRIPKDLAPFKDLLQFSKGMAGLALLNLIFSRMDVFVLAKLFSEADLGLYSMGIYLVQTPVTFLMRIIAQTIYPTFAHVQDNPARENRILLNLTSATLLLGLPVLVFLGFSGHSVLTIVYGARYGAAAIALTLAACAALLNVLNAQLTMVFYSQGMPQLHRRAVAAMAVVVAVLTRRRSGPGERNWRA